MNYRSAFTSDQLADTGRALYGERWQSALAADLHVGDRALRRWLTGEAPIPENIGHELRALLIERMNTMGGMLGYSVHPSERRVFHYPTAAWFQYDDDDNFTPLHPVIVPADDIPLLMQGAREALRQERERNQRGVKAMYADAVTGQLNAAGEIEQKYNGCVIIYSQIPMFPGKWTVNLVSENPHLLMKLRGDTVVTSFVSLEDAIEKAKQRVDTL